MLKSEIDSAYIKLACSRITQGDILRDLNFSIIRQGTTTVQLTFLYIVVLSQDCDLEQRYLK